MQTLTRRQPRGFIALISATLISAILILVAVSGSIQGLTVRYDILVSEYKERSYSLANACAQWMLMRLYYDSNYPTGYTLPDTVTIGSDSCSIKTCTSSGSSRTCNIQAVYQNAYTNVVVTASNTAKPAIDSFIEVPSF